MNEQEWILCAAVHYDDGQDTYIHQPKNIKTGYVVAGRRHHNCITIHSMLKGLRDVPNNFPIIQGFLTSRDRFVNREEAFDIAEGANQLNDRTRFTNRTLFSEDLY